MADLDLAPEIAEGVDLWSRERGDDVDVVGRPRSPVHRAGDRAADEVLDSQLLELGRHAQGDGDGLVLAAQRRCLSRYASARSTRFAP
jgi:hypothetical protein